MNLELIDSARLASSELQESASLCPRSRVKVKVTAPSLLCWCWGSEPETSSLHGRHLPLPIPTFISKTPELPAILGPLSCKLA